MDQPQCASKLIEVTLRANLPDTVKN